MCTRDYNFEDLNTIHHELGHIQYQQQYSDLPQVFRDGANDGFHEAIGELMAMAGATPKHLYSIGLIEELIEDEKLDANFLMSQSLITISTLPFHLGTLHTVDYLFSARAHCLKITLNVAIDFFLILAFSTNFLSY